MPLIEPSPETYESILALRVVRNYTDEPVDPEDLAAILEAGRWTGSSKNTQAWRFVILDEEAERMRLADAGSFTEPMRRAPLAIALVRTDDGGDFDIGRLAQNLMLAAAALGIGSCPVTLHDEAAAATILDLPAGSSCRFAVTFGHPDEAAERAERASRSGMAGRKPMEELLSE